MLAKSTAALIATDAEKRLAGQLLQGRQVDMSAGLLGLDSIRRLFQVAEEVRGAGQEPNLSTISQALRLQGRLDEYSTNGASLLELVQLATSEAYIPDDVRAVKDAFHRREGVSLFERGLELARGPDPFNGNFASGLFPEIQAFREKLEFESEPNANVFTARALACTTTDTAQDCLLGKDRWLCPGMWATFSGPTGIGKSVAVAQMGLLWALGKPAFGIQPMRALSVLYVQSENDGGDLGEMLRGIGVWAGRRPDELPETFYAVRHIASTGPEFIAGTLRPLLRQLKPDLLILDPLQRYLGGDTAKAADCLAFITPFETAIVEHGCAALVVCHTNKPPSGAEKREWSGNELSYLASGSHVLADSPRATLAIRGSGSHTHFELVASKRGARIGWPDQEGGKPNTRYIAHAQDGGMHWRTLDPEEWQEELDGQGIGARDEGKGKGKLSNAKVREVLTSRGDLSFYELKAALQGKHGVSDRTASRAISRALDDGKISKDLNGRYICQ